MNQNYQSPAANRWRFVIDLTAAFAMILAAAFVIFNYARGVVVVEPPERSEPPLPTMPISVKGAMMQGSPTAKVAIIEYSDFECPFCGEFARQTLPTLQEKYIKTGRVQFYFFHNPLLIHAEAEKAAEAGVCAARQGKGWEMHDALFADQKHLDTVSIETRAQRLGLDRRGFEACLGGQARAQVQDDVAAAAAAQMRGTPGFFVGILRGDGLVEAVKRVRGAQETKVFEQVLGELIARTQK